jgi:hypothetical protein
MTNSVFLWLRANRAMPPHPHPLSLRAVDLPHDCSAFWHVRVHIGAAELYPVTCRLCGSRYRRCCRFSRSGRWSLY